MCEDLKVQIRPETELQGPLMAGMAEKMGDPDSLVQAWLKRGSVPLGIKNPIEPGGDFPAAEQSQAEVDTDLHFWLDNYASYKDHQAGAEEILAKEQNKGRL